MARFLLLTIITLVALLVTVSAGRCQKLTSWADDIASRKVTPLNGFNQPVCLKIMNQAGFTHFWFEDESIPDGKVDGTCVDEAQWMVDRESFAYSNLFQFDAETGDSLPSPLCQQILVSGACFAYFHPCDPEIDTPEAGHVTRKSNKVCRWVCQLTADNPEDDSNDIGKDGVLCNYKDREFLNTYGLDARAFKAVCYDDTVYSDDDDCIAPNVLETSPIAPRCELYSGSVCSDVFSDGTLVYVPAGIDQEIIEQQLQFDWYFLSLPRDDNSCAASLTRLFCQSVFPECSDKGLKDFKVKKFTTEIDPASVGVSVTHALPLRVQVEACEEFKSNCASTAIFNHPLIKQFFPFPDCNTEATINANQCFPTDLKLEWATDYVAKAVSNHLGLPVNTVERILSSSWLSDVSHNDRTSIDVLSLSTNHTISSRGGKNDVFVDPETDVFDLLFASADSNELDTDDVYELIMRSVGDNQDFKNLSQQEVLDKFTSAAAIYFQKQQESTLSPSSSLFNPAQKTDADDDAANPNFKRYTIAQTQTIINTNKVYSFNSKNYLGRYETIPTVYLGPQIDEVNFDRHALLGQIQAGSFPPVSPQASFVSTDCIAPLVYPDNAEDQTLFGGACAIPCPSPRFSSKQRRDIEIGSLIMVCIALLFSAMLSLTFIIFKSQRHKKNLFFYTLSYFGAAVMMFIGLMNRSDQNSVYANQCTTNTRLEHMTGFALFQSMFLVYFFVASSCWWCMQSIDLFEKLILGRSYRRGTIQYKRRTIATHVFCWGLPFLAVLGLICAGQLGYDGYLPFSLIGQSDQMTSRSPIVASWYFLFAPVVICALFGLVLVGIILFYLIQYDPSGGLKKFTDKVEKSSSSWFKVQQSLKLFGFVFLMIFFIVLFAMFQIHIGANEVSWSEKDVEWGQMVLIAGREGSGAMDHGMSPGWVLATVAGFCSPGFVMFLLFFVLDNQVWRLWCGVLYFNLGFSFLKTWALEDTLTATDSQATGSNSSKGTGSTDIFTGDVTLTDRAAKKNESQPGSQLSEPSKIGNASSATKNRSTADTAGSGASSADHPSGVGLITSMTSSVGAKAALQRKSTLFKGFSKGGSARSGLSFKDTQTISEISHSESASDSFHFHNQSGGIEMAEVTTLDEVIHEEDAETESE